MKMILNEDDIKTIIMEHLRNNGYIVNHNDVEVKGEIIANINNDFKIINYPLCTKVTDNGYPRCMNLINKRYCSRNGGCC